MEKKKSVCKACGGEVVLIEGWSGEAVGYGYGEFKCLNCGAISDYYGTGLKTIVLKPNRNESNKSRKKEALSRQLEQAFFLSQRKSWLEMRIVSS